MVLLGAGGAIEDVVLLLAGESAGVWTPVGVVTEVLTLKVEVLLLLLLEVLLLLPLALLLLLLLRLLPLTSRRLLLLLLLCCCCVTK